MRFAAARAPPQDVGFYSEPKRMCGLNERCGFQKLMGGFSRGLDGGGVELDWRLCFRATQRKRSVEFGVFFALP
jgi:hypothetical protein